MLPHSVRLDMTLEGTNGDETLLRESTDVVVKSRTENTTSFQVGDIPWGTYKLSMRSVESGLNFQDVIDLRYDPMEIHALVQTDKPVYRPGDKIRFRVVVIDGDSKPVTSIRTVKIKLLDAIGRIFRQWPYARLKNGVFDSEVQLPALPVNGNWTFSVMTPEKSVEKIVLVEEYELPRFFVRVFPPEILLIPKRKIRIAVEAVDAFGMQVEGTARVDLYLDKPGGTPEYSKVMSTAGIAVAQFDLRDELKIENRSHGFKNVLVKAQVTETNTNHTVKQEQTIPVFMHPYKITAKLMPQFSPHVPFPVEILLIDHYGKPVPNGLYAEITVSYEGLGSLNEAELVERFDERFDKYGVASFILRPPLNAIRMFIMVNYASVDYGIVGSSEIANSQDKQFIRATMQPGTKISPGRKVTLDVCCSENMNQFSYVVGAKNTMITSGTIPVENKPSSELQLTLMPEMSPKATLLIYHIGNDSLIFDEIDLIFDTFSNDFDLRLDRSDLLPGQDVVVEVEASNDSYIALGAIDQNAFLVGPESHDFTRRNVLDLLKMMDFFISTTTDVKMSRTNATRINTLHTPVLKSKLFAKSKLHETSLWKAFPMNGESKMLNSMDQLPDKVAPWLLSGFALSPTLGLGFMSEPQMISVRKLFYVVADLPYSVKRNTPIHFYAMVYNYLDNTLVTDVTLYSKNNEFEILERKSDDDAFKTKIIAIPPNGKKPVSFMITPRTLGEITVRIEANNILASDSTEQVVRVVPEGYLVEKKEAKFIELNRRGRLNYELNIDIPRNIDEGSANVKLMLYGDILGPPIMHMEALIRPPAGSGEENMLIFAYNVAVLDYLTETGTLKDDTGQLVIYYLENGYQKQQDFKQRDGSFSDAGSADLIGSTLLTAFAAKWFSKASKFIEVDKAMVSSAFRWLASAQKSNGRAVEFGKINNPDMKGDLLTGKYALTAYVLAAFLENEDAAAEHRLTTAKMMNYLAKKMNNINDLHDLAITTYAVSLGKHNKSNDFFDKLYRSSMFDSVNGSHYYSRPPSDIEATGYALLSFILNEKLIQATSIMRWLQQQQYTSAGAQSFVGLEALTKLAAHENPQKNDLRVVLSHHNRRMKVIDMDQNNAQKTEMTIPSNIRMLDVQIEGIGRCVLQLIYQYCLDAQKTKSNYMIDATVLNSSTHYEQHLKVCVRYTGRDTTPSTEPVFVEVFFPSGFIADEEGIKDLSTAGKIRQTDIRFGASSVVVFYDSMGYENNCFQITSYRRFKAAMHRPAYVVVSDTRDSGRMAVKSYEGTIEQKCDICLDQKCTATTC
ncbi:thioester-containing protein 1 allele S3-like isoform X2 [Wyeomyia smithii]|nr:thioester-containing protein 1 allele S3-like isoform X2 [Wyeomyia smithii]XP_055530868.1 thioester-containing protein 1 allele S3-like isoform X2 [Wyeomyia smithii]XP_055530869.1 thioester-containing protein 1 allele S3-like isoform X2 [Wyeomyia smithii]XP_055530870.1 thioester-containing protein 1 allele S3-like isoform X2 [Wyeomyia smithii]XP_055530871.1 thioester-containing protein 1 allele S3-like isoform X2 [Wyeomyia smithii]